MTGRYSARGVDKDPGWIERRFREQASELAALRVGKLSAVPGSTVTIQQILTDPASPIGFVNTDVLTVTATGTQTMLLTQTPIDGSTHVYWNGLELSATEWTRTGRLLTITDPGVRVDDVFTAFYAYDTVAASNPGADDPSYLTLMASLNPLWFARLNESSGTTMTDHSTFGRNGTYSNVTLGATGLIPSLADTSGTFNGTSSAGTVTYASWMNLATIGLVAWISPATITFVHSVLDRDNTSTGRAWQFRKNTDGKVEFVFFTTTGGPFTCTGTTVMMDDFTDYMIAATYDGATAKVYLNGAVDGTLTQAGTLHNTGSADLNVGVSRSGTAGAAAQWFSGDIQAPAVFSSLTADNIADLYAAGGV